MVDSEIITLFWNRSEQALSETKAKYGHYCHSIAYRILDSHPDAEECENDTYLAVWNSIPPEKPSLFSAYLGKITRNLALKRLRSSHAQKRGGNTATLSLDELAECVPDGQHFDELLAIRELANALSQFLRSLKEPDRSLFICRYWYCESVTDIATQFGFSQSKVKMILLRTREKLRTFLQKEGLLHEQS